jgi:nucleotide sugar dehydrogenase
MSHAFGILGYDKQEPNDVLGLGCQLPNPLKALVENVDGPIFVCVPTPMQPSGVCDTSIVEEVVFELDRVSEGLKPVVVVKSTVPPGTTESLNAKCKNVIVVFNPEFLREVSAVEDFKNQDRLIIGGPHEGTMVVKQMYQIAYPDVPTTKTSSTIAELVKYVTNCFLACKVAFANEIHQICERLDVDYDKVIEYATKDKRLGTSHWAVPGPDGSLGFGGKCFCKDLNGLMALAKALGIEPMVMEGAWSKNLEVRPERDWEKIVGVLSETKSEKDRLEVYEISKPNSSIGDSVYDFSGNLIPQIIHFPDRIIFQDNAEIPSVIYFNNLDKE